MVKLYASWAPGLIDDKKALAILKDSRIISGIELSNFDRQIDRLRESGLEVALHTPGLELTSNLANPDYMGIFNTDEGKRILSVIKESEAPVVSFHCGYSAGKVYKMAGFPNIPEPGSVITDKEILVRVMVQNLTLLENLINSGGPSPNKQVLIENLDYSKERPVSWEKQTEERRRQRDKLEKSLAMYGINGIVHHVTEPLYLKEVLDKVQPANLMPIGLLFDITHLILSYYNQKIDGKMDASFEDYFNSMLEAGKGRTYQLHLSLPGGSDNEGYIDAHLPFKQGDYLSDRIAYLARTAARKSPELLAITLEMKEDKTPVEHAKKMVQMADYVINNIL